MSPLRLWSGAALKRGVVQVAAVLHNPWARQSSVAPQAATALARVLTANAATEIYAATGID